MPSLNLCGLPRNGFYLIALLIALLIFAIVLGVTLSDTDWNSYENASSLLKSTPLIDGHNDLAWNIRLVSQNHLSDVNLYNISESIAWRNCTTCMTDITRLKQGQVAAQFWSAYVSCKSQYKDAVTQTMEQIDIIHRFIKEYSDSLTFVSSSEEIINVWKSGKIASLIGVEGGHSIDSRISLLRIYYDLGVRYLTLTHTCHTPWAESSVADENPPIISTSYGLTDFGKDIVLEMNRLGMIVDISHTSEKTQIHALHVSKAPVIFSHSSAYTICPHSRNVKDEILQLLVQNGGIIMINFYSKFIQCDSNKNATIDDILDHLNHIRNVTGSANFIGIGGDYDGVSSLPVGLEDPSKYPIFFNRLLTSSPSWTIEELKKIAGLNLLRVFKKIEEVKEALITTSPSESQLPFDQIPLNATLCRQSN